MVAPFLIFSPDLYSLFLRLKDIQIAEMIFSRQNLVKQVTMCCFFTVKDVFFAKLFSYSSLFFITIQKR